MGDERDELVPGEGTPIELNPQVLEAVGSLLRGHVEAPGLEVFGGLVQHGHGIEWKLNLQGYVVQIAYRDTNLLGKLLGLLLLLFHQVDAVFTNLCLEHLLARKLDHHHLATHLVVVYNIFVVHNLLVAYDILAAFCLLVTYDLLGAIRQSTDQVEDVVPHGCTERVQSSQRSIGGLNQGPSGGIQIEYPDVPVGLYADPLPPNKHEVLVVDPDHVVVHPSLRPDLDTQHDFLPIHLRQVLVHHKLVQDLVVSPV